MQVKLRVNVITINILNQEPLFAKVRVFWTAIISLPFSLLYVMS
jgi:hypothetical protein